MKELKEFSGMYFDKNTPAKVMQIIVDNLGRGKRLRFWYGDTKTGKSWNEENDICGYIGRSTGWQKIPLLISRKDSSGGGHLLDGCIIKIVETKTNNVLFQHPKFNQSFFMAVDKSDLPEYSANVLQDNEIYARCKSYNSAQRLADYMNGKRHNK